MFLEIQFKYKNNVPSEFKTAVVEQFTNMKLHNLGFLEFFKALTNTV